MDDFDRFWKEYPKRAGALNKSGARTSFQNKVRQGADPEKIIAAAKIYARKRDWVDGAGFYQKQFADRLIPMAQTWLNQKRYEDYAEEAKPKIDAAEAERLAKWYREKREREGWV